ncbi:MAG: ribosome silencing factor [Cyanobacteria bacterium]|nr:ribosome silencing factor [Cyanobacteriota bacterium]
MSSNTPNSLDLASLIANMAEQKKSLQTTVLDTHQVSTFADYFVICTTDSAVQTKTLMDAIEGILKREYGIEAIGKERDRQGTWCLLDYGDVIVHVMHRQAHDYYQLEQFWNHAKVLPLQSWQHKKWSQAS